VPEHAFFDLTGQAAVVTGAGRGIGRAVAKALAQAGASVAVCSRTSEDLDGLVAEITEEGGTAVACVLDVADLDRLQQMIRDVAERFGRLDILVNNAGISQMHDAVNATEEEWDRVLDVNAKGPFFACQAAGRIMIERGYGRIVNVTSMGGRVGWRRAAAYCASKGALEQVTRVLALEWARQGVTVNAVAPGFIASSMTAERMQDEEYLSWILERSPIGRTGSPLDIVPAILYLVSPQSGLVTGSTVTIDGGWTAE
jgi:NAD(P)-dependent dehydrogenase (short-subunit alcohol dehydrogenase family)